MVQTNGRKKLIIASAVVAAVLLIVVAIVVIKNLSADTPTESTTTSKKDTPAISEDSNSTDTAPTVEPETTTPETTVDPAQTATVTIEPMAITAAYVKGIGGFDYQVSRTPSGTKYVEFSSEKLVGTKCTNDKGPFASIIESPTSDESTTLAKKTTVDKTDYGLSLADATCTSDAELLKQYQDAFSSAFSLLKKM
ncbi:MAG: hypothetical protein JWO54_16 [Candidatus Saccharibacteria bacterium]|nr:hypothetical protein [Candidatus Saccharibacteria bacterium]MDB5180258.1 hypothetical protein [Candidatus Saccharibacteria bacterium]